MVDTDRSVTNKVLAMLAAFTAHPGPHHRRHPAGLGWTTVQLYLAVAGILLLAAVAVFFIRPQRSLTVAGSPTMTSETV